MQDYFELTCSKPIVMTLEVEMRYFGIYNGRTHTAIVCVCVCVCVCVDHVGKEASVKNVLVPKKDTQKKAMPGNFLVVQWLGPCSFTAEGQTSIPHWGTKSLQATWHSQKKQNKTKTLLYIPGCYHVWL